MSDNIPIHNIGKRVCQFACYNQCFLSVCVLADVTLLLCFHVTHGHDAHQSVLVFHVNVRSCSPYTRPSNHRSVRVKCSSWTTRSSKSNSRSTSIACESFRVRFAQSLHHQRCRRRRPQRLRRNRRLRRHWPQPVQFIAWRRLRRRRRRRYRAFRLRRLQQCRRRSLRWDHPLQECRRQPHRLLSRRPFPPHQHHVVRCPSQRHQAQHPRYRLSQYKCCSRALNRDRRQWRLRQPQLSRRRRFPLRLRQE